MRTFHFLVVLIAFGLVACSESPSEQGASEQGQKKPGLSSGMSDDIWKAYSGTESGVTDARKDEPQAKKDQPQKKEAQPGEKK